MTMNGTESIHQGQSDLWGPPSVNTVAEVAAAHLVTIATVTESVAANVPSMKKTRRGVGAGTGIGNNTGTGRGNGIGNETDIVTG